MTAESSFKLAQAVLENLSKDAAELQEPFGLEPRGAEVLRVALIAVSEDSDEIVDLAKALKGAGYHFSLIRTLKSKKIITRKNGVDNWAFTKDAVKKLTKLAVAAPDSLQRPSAPQPPAPPSSAAAQDGLPDKNDQAIALLDRLSLGEHAAYLNTRLNKVDEQIEAIRKKSEEDVSALEQQRREAQTVLQRIAGEVV